MASSRMARTRLSKVFYALVTREYYISIKQCYYLKALVQPNWIFLSDITMNTKTEIKYSGTKICGIWGKQASQFCGAGCRCC